MVKFLNQIDWFFLENPWVYEFMKIVYELKKMYFSEKSFNAVYLYQEGIDQQYGSWTKNAVLLRNLLGFLLGLTDVFTVHIFSARAQKQF